MKKILFVLGFIAFTASLSAQDFKYLNVSDTIITSSSLDTLTWVFPVSGPFKGPFYWEANIQADSLSGTIDASVAIEYQPVGSTLWIPISGKTLTITGTLSQALLSGNQLGGTIRARVLAPSSTQQCKVSISFEKANKTG